MSQQEEETSPNEPFRFSLLQGDYENNSIHIDTSSPPPATPQSPMPINMISSRDSRDNSEIVSPLCEKDVVDEAQALGLSHQYLLGHFNDDQCSHTISSVRIMNRYLLDYNLRNDSPYNIGFLSIHPHANTQAMRDTVQSVLLAHIDNMGLEGGGIIAQYDIPSEFVAQRGLCDNNIWAKYAMIVKGRSALSSNEYGVEFEKIFDEKLDVVKSENRIVNAREAMIKFEWDEQKLYESWHKCRNLSNSSKEQNASSGSRYRFFPGCDCAQMNVNGQMYYILNGFYMLKRSEYLHEDISSHVYVFAWDSHILNWKDFISDAIGDASLDTDFDPSQANGDIIRSSIYDRYESLGILDHAPKGSTCRNRNCSNIVYTSGSALAALSDRIHWCGTTVTEDYFGRILLGNGIPESKILEWCENPVVMDLTQSMQYIFGIVEGMNSGECIQYLIKLYDRELSGLHQISNRRKCNFCIIS